MAIFLVGFSFRCLFVFFWGGRVGVGRLVFHDGCSFFGGREMT